MPVYSMANPWRGEVDIELDGVHYVMRPTFAALSSIEQALDTGLVALSRRLIEGALGVHELSVIIAAAIAGAGNNEPFPVKNIEESLIKNGLTNAFCAVAEMLAKVFEGVDHA